MFNVVALVGMDRIINAQSFQVASWFLKRRAILLFLISLLLLPTGLTHLILWRIEHDLDLSIDRTPLITFHPGTIDLDGSLIDWKHRFQVRGEKLKVRYPVVRVFWSSLPMTIEGKELTVKFSTEIAALVGQKEVVFDDVSAKVLISASKGVEVEHLDATSKTIEFHLGEKQFM